MLSFLRLLVFRTKRRKNPTRWGGTYPYGFYKGVPPRAPSGLKSLCNIQQIVTLEVETCVGEEVLMRGEQISVSG